MKRLFAIWLTIFVVLAFIITLVFSYQIQSKLAQETTLAMLEDNLSDAEKRIMFSNDNLRRVKELTENGALAKTRAFARIIRDNQKIKDGLNAFEQAISNIENEVSNLDKRGKAKAYNKAILSCPEYPEIKKIFLRICEDFYIDELTVTDGKGIMICSNPEAYIGYDMSSEPQSGEFVKKLIDNENINEFVQEPMPNGYSKNIFHIIHLLF